MRKITMCYPGGRDRALTLSYDDGVGSDCRLIEILQQNRMKGTFNINSGLFAPEDKIYPPGTVHRRLSLSGVLDCYSEASGMEVAVHGQRHPFWDRLPAATTAMDILNDRIALEQSFGRIVRGAAYPYGAHSDAVVDILRQCGIAYCRTTHTTHSLSLPENWLLWHPTCHHKSTRLMEMAEKFVTGVDFDKPRLLYVWGHSYEFDGDNNWHIIEEFASYVGNRDEIWYATNLEIFDYVDAFSRLQFAADLSRVHNPTAVTLWFRSGDTVFCVGPGETLAL